MMKKSFAIVAVYLALGSIAHADDDVRQKAHEAAHSVKHAAHAVGQGVRAGAHRVADGARHLKNRVMGRSKASSGHSSSSHPDRSNN